MKQLVVICGLLVFVVGCTTTPPRESIQSKPVAAMPSPSSQPMKAVAEPATPTTPKMIEVAVKTEPAISARASHLSQPTIAIAPTPATPSYDPKPLRFLLHDRTPSQTQSARARQHEEIVIVPQSVAPRTNAVPRFIDVTAFDETPDTTHSAETSIIAPSAR